MLIRACMLMTCLLLAPVAAVEPDLDGLHAILTEAVTNAQAEGYVPGTYYTQSAAGGILQGLGDVRGDAWLAAADALVPAMKAMQDAEWDIRSGIAERAGWSGQVDPLVVKLSTITAGPLRMEALWTAGISATTTQNVMAKQAIGDLLLAEWQQWQGSDPTYRTDPEWTEGGPEDVWSWNYDVVEILAAFGRFDEALGVVEATTDPISRAQAHLVFGVELARAGQTERASNVLHAVLATLPPVQPRPADEDEAWNLDSAYSSVANLHAFLGDIDAANAVIATLVDPSTRLYAMFDVAEQQWRSGDMTAGTATMQAALGVALFSDNAYSAFDGLLVWGRYGDIDQAKAWITASGAMREYMPDGDCLLALGMGVAARLHDNASP